VDQPDSVVRERASQRLLHNYETFSVDRRYWHAVRNTVHHAVGSVRIRQCAVDSSGDAAQPETASGINIHLSHYCLSPGHHAGSGWVVLILAPFSPHLEPVSDQPSANPNAIRRR